MVEWGIVFIPEINIGGLKLFPSESNISKLDSAYAPSPITFSIQSIDIHPEWSPSVIVISLMFS